ncbi:ABC transporter substrate-binding protein [Desulfobacula toluolica]|uniref:Putative ABC transporter substrate-binding protein n=1 Tax=Desulfobacula toluolica (strain DSM 7467 / Tol2) TaxID=651182 RepID=K0NDW9_DESTT|nr:ABC transporter substrate binding protein [Desulfobacula toluolica]CCK79106.1 putative ABC transporter substrate-binding protein [Desulfobacula toluolica Tol2]
MKIFHRFGCLMPVALAISAVCAFSGTETLAAGEKKFRILLVETMPVPVVTAHSQWFVRQLAELGYEDKKNMDLIILKVNGDKKRGEHLLKQELKQARPDLVATCATLASQIAHDLLHEKDIPQIFFTVSDPVGAGLIKEIGKPTHNHITGVVHMIERKTRINMAMRLLENRKKQGRVKIGFIHSTYPSSVGDLKQLQLATASRKDIEFVPYGLDYREMPKGLDPMLADVKKGIQSLQGRVDFWWEPSGPLGELLAYTRLLLEKSNIPVIMGTKLESVRLGALFHLTPDPESSGREAALMADAVLKGLHPGNISVKPPQSISLGINITTALAQGIVIPPDILSLAGDQVYR